MSPSLKRMRDGRGEEVKRMTALLNKVNKVKLGGELVRIVRRSRKEGNTNIAEQLRELYEKVPDKDLASSLLSESIELLSPGECLPDFRDDSSTTSAQSSLSAVKIRGGGGDESSSENETPRRPPRQPAGHLVSQGGGSASRHGSGGVSGEAAQQEPPRVGDGMGGGMPLDGSPARGNITLQRRRSANAGAPSPAPGPAPGAPAAALAQGDLVGENAGLNDSAARELEVKLVKLEVDRFFAVWKTVDKSIISLLYVKNQVRNKLSITLDEHLEKVIEARTRLWKRNNDQQVLAMNVDTEEKHTYPTLKACSDHIPQVKNNQVTRFCE